MRGRVSRAERRGLAVPHPRKAGSQESLRIRDYRRQLRIFAGSGRAAHPADATQGGQAPAALERTQSAGGRNSTRRAYYAAHVSEADGENRRQAGGAGSFVSKSSLG